MGWDSGSGDTSYDDATTEIFPSSSAASRDRPKPGPSSRLINVSDIKLELSDDKDALFKPPTSCSEDISDSDGPWKKSFNTAFKSVKIHSCTFEGCKRTFTRPWRLTAHVRTHNGERPFKCTVDGCDREYTNNAHLRRHTQRNHNTTVPKTKIRCPHEGCCMELAETSLSRHIERRHRAVRFPCPVCGLEFAKHSRLSEHAHQHEPSGLPIYKCDKCDAGFFEKAPYVKHHNKHRTYTCSFPQCSFSCSVWSVLRRHNVVEHPAEKFTCAECDRTFGLKTSLRVHMETHKDPDERLVFRCRHDGCGSCYYQRRNLTAHIRRRHGDQLFKCTQPQCKQALSTMQKLTEHIDKQHGVASSTKTKKKSKPKRYSNVGKPSHSMATLMLGVKLPQKKERKLVTFNCQLPSPSLAESGPSGVVASGTEQEDSAPKLNSLHKLLGAESDSTSVTDGP